MSNEETIDATDLKIIERLQEDARTSLNLMAEECKLSSSAILTRIKKLKQKKVIIGNRLIVRSEAFGYPFMATVGVIAEAQKIDQITQKIRSQPNVIVCTKSIGRYNMLFLILAQNMAELDSATQKIKNIDGVKALSVNLILERFSSRIENKPLKIKSKEELDNLDLAIIGELMNDSSLSFNRISKKVQASHETIRKKFEKLKEKGVIIGCITIIDYSKLGYQGTAFIFVKLTQEGQKKFVIEELIKMRQLDLINSVIGTYDLIAFASFKNLREFTKLIDEMQRIPGIGQIEMSLANFTYFAYKPIPKTQIKCDTVELS
ncbi:MAG: Lrp/AsnC family transcriptional regulator [Candidatus Bathyarchaeota archaeon]|nr:Lrp/AsnC family transcriptional regulator [Candidatus Bathyarchaeota archaeon]